MLACLFCRVYGVCSMLLCCIYHALLLNVRKQIHSALPEPVIPFSFHTIIIICTVIGSIHATMAHSVCWDQCKITLELRYRTVHLNWHQNDRSTSALDNANENWVYLIYTAYPLLIVMWLNLLCVTLNLFWMSTIMLFTSIHIHFDLI